MALQDLQSFLVALSKHASLRAALKSDPEAVMTEAGLSDEEKKLVRSGDVAALKKHLGDTYAAASSVQLT